EETPAHADADAVAEPVADDIADEVGEATDDARATRDLAPTFLEEFGEAQEPDEHASADAGDGLDAETGPSAEMSAPIAAAHAAYADVADTPDMPDALPEPERPRHHTLAS